MSAYAFIIDHDLADAGLDHHVSFTDGGGEQLAHRLHQDDQIGDRFLLLDGDAFPVALGRFMHQDFDGDRGFTRDKSEDWFAPKDWGESQWGATEIHYLEKDKHDFNIWKHL